MEHEFTQSGLTLDFAFLNHREVHAHFADLNIALLAGRHIQTGEGYHFTLVNNYSDEFRFFYRSLYGLELKQARTEQIDYYYLDFPEEGKGRLNNTNRFREMTTWEILFALMLLNMYYDRFFEQTKIISWALVRTEIEESELSPLYKKAFFNDSTRENFTDPEWKSLLDNFKRVLRNLDRWGWVKILPQDETDGELTFLIRESIDRFGKIYQYEISDFDNFIEQLRQKRTRA